MSSLEVIEISIAGFIFFITGLYIIDRDYRVKKKGKRARGTVIDIKERPSTDSEGDTHTMYHLIIHFKDSKGNDVTKELDFSSSIKPTRRVPYKIPIFYLEEKNDYIVVLAKNSTKMIIAYLILGIGILLLIFVLLSETNQLEPLKKYFLNLFS